MLSEAMTKGLRFIVLKELRISLAKLQTADISKYMRDLKLYNARLLTGEDPGSEPELGKSPQEEKQEIAEIELLIAQIEEEVIQHKAKGALSRYQSEREYVSGVYHEREAKKKDEADR